MASDPDAREITINYEGGSLSMALGNAKDLFGENSPVVNPPSVDKNVSVKSHSRTRVIGGPTTSISAFQYTYKQWPTSTSGNAKGGKIIYMSWESSEGEWTARVSGSMADLGAFLISSAAKTTTFRTQRGTKYGPFAGVN